MKHTFGSPKMDCAKSGGATLGFLFTLNKMRSCLFSHKIFINGHHYEGIPILLIVEKLAFLHDVTDSRTMKLFSSNMWSVLFFGGRLFGAIFIGGVILDYLGFYWTNLCFALLTLCSSFTTVITLRQIDLLKRIYHSDK